MTYRDARREVLTEHSCLLLRRGARTVAPRVGAMPRAPPSPTTSPGFSLKPRLEFCKALQACFFEACRELPVMSFKSPCDGPWYQRLRLPSSSPYSPEITDRVRFSDGLN